VKDLERPGFRCFVDRRNPGADFPSLSRLLVGSALVLVPLLIYPGNWSSNPPWGPPATLVWQALALGVYVSLVVGIGLLVAGVRRLLLYWKGLPDGKAPRRRALAEALLTPSSRRIFGGVAVAYILFFGAFTSLLGFSLHGAISAPQYPDGYVVLCCGPVGLTPGIVTIPGPWLQISVDPAALLFLSAGVVFLGTNLAAARALSRQGGSRATVGTAVGLGSVGALLVSCPTCGTVLLFNILGSVTATGLLLTWYTWQTPLLLAAFPLSFAVTVWTADRLSRTAACSLSSPALRSVPSRSEEATFLDDRGNSL